MVIRDMTKSYSGFVIQEFSGLRFKITSMRRWKVGICRVLERKSLVAMVTKPVIAVPGIH